MNTNIQKLKDLIKAKAEYQIELKKNRKDVNFTGTRLNYTYKVWNRSERKYDEYVDWNNRRKYKQRKLAKKVQKEEDYKKAIALKQEYDKYTKGNPQKSPINEENKLTAR